MGTTIVEFITYFEDIIRKREKEKTNRGNTPLNPMILFYLGKGTETAHACVAQKLLDVWPQYKEELFAFFVPEYQNPVYKSIAVDGFIEDADFDQIQIRTTELFGENAHFPDRSLLQLHFCLDTTSITDERDMAYWFDLIRSISAQIANRVEKRVHFLLLLNEDFSHEKCSKEIRNSFSDYNLEGIDVSFILSNRLSNALILTNFSKAYMLYANLIMRMNSEAHINNGVYTASYSLQEKPIRSIGQVVVETTIDCACKLREENASVRLEDADLEARLGITRNKTINCLDSYIDGMNVFPTEAELQFFARREAMEITDVSNMTATSFDELCMGAWSAYLDHIVEDFEMRVHSGQISEERWVRDYQDMLLRNFSADEIIREFGDMERIESMFSGTLCPSKEEKVLPYAKSCLRYSLSTNAIIREAFISEVKKVRDQAEEYLAAWDDLRNSSCDLFEIEDSNLRDFYTRNVQNFFRQNYAKLRARIKSLHEREELTNFLYDTIGEIIASDKVYTAPFEVELAIRLEAVAGDSTKNATFYILKGLVSDEIPTYLETISSLSDPILSLVFLQTDSELHKNLKENLKNVYYYNTGCITSAESVAIYAVDTVRHLHVN